MKVLQYNLFVFILKGKYYQIFPKGSSERYFDDSLYPHWASAPVIMTFIIIRFAFALQHKKEEACTQRIVSLNIFKSDSFFIWPSSEAEVYLFAFISVVSR